jgi:hypothetical protein
MCVIGWLLALPTIFIIFLFAWARLGRCYEDRHD